LSLRERRRNGFWHVDSLLSSSSNDWRGKEAILTGSTWLIAERDICERSMDFCRRVVCRIQSLKLCWSGWNSWLNSRLRGICIAGYSSNVSTVERCDTRLDRHWLRFFGHVVEKRDPAVSGPRYLPLELELSADTREEDQIEGRAGWKEKWGFWKLR
jgi:hypothetical protein